MMAISPRKSGAYAKTGDLRTVWGKFQRKPFIMAIPQEKASLTPKLAGGVGKIEAEPVYHGDCATKRDPIGETIWISETIRIGEAKRGGPCHQSD